VAARAGSLAAALPPATTTIDATDVDARLRAFSHMISHTMVLSALLARALGGARPARSTVNRI
jgi:hypothetical protein